jgi:hypothetical protein
MLIWINLNGLSEPLLVNECGNQAFEKNNEPACGSNTEAFVA